MSTEKVQSGDKQQREELELIRSVLYGFPAGLARNDALRAVHGLLDALSTPSHVATPICERHLDTGKSVCFRPGCAFNKDGSCKNGEQHIASPSSTRRSVALVTDDRLVEIYADASAQHMRECGHCAGGAHKAGLRAIVQACDDGYETFASSATATPTQDFIDLYEAALDVVTTITEDFGGPEAERHAAALDVLRKVVAATDGKATKEKP